MFKKMKKVSVKPDFCSFGSCIQVTLTQTKSLLTLDLEIPKVSL